MLADNNYVIKEISLAVLEIKKFSKFLLSKDSDTRLNAENRIKYYESTIKRLSRHLEV